MKNLKITTAKIAEICNVSQGTVDRALHNRPGIKAETKQKILSVARQYGFRADMQMPEKENRGQIGIIVFNLNNEYFSELITEAEYAFREEGFSTVVALSHYDGAYEIECIRSLYNMGVEGIIVCSVNSGKDFENYLKLFDIPIVAVGNRIGGLPYVGIDDFVAMQDIIEKVLAEKPQNIIYFSPALHYGNAEAPRRRYEGFLSKIGDASYTVVTNIEDIQSTYAETTTVIASSDYYALQVYFKTQNVKVVGFDNISALDKYKIGIDSLGYSMSEIARGAVDIIRGRKKESIIVAHHIVQRNEK